MSAPEPGSSIPPAPPIRHESRTEIIHGVPVADPFRMLEDGNAPLTRSWVAAQNERTDAVLSSLPTRPVLRERLLALLGAGSSVACAVGGEHAFSLERWGSHDQSVLVVRSATEPGPARTIVDPHLQTGDPTAAIDWFRPSPDGSLVAYGMSTGGDERSTLRIVDVATGEHRRDTIPHTRACSIAWMADNSSFAYTRYPDPAALATEDQGYWRKVYWHRLGADWHRDELVFGDLPDKTAWTNLTLSPDGRWLILHLSLGWSRVDVHLVDRRSGARTAMIEGIEAVSSFVVVGDQVVGLTTLDAGRGRIVAAPLVTAWHDHWRTIVDESDRVIDAFVPTASSLLVLSSSAAVSRLDRHHHDGTHVDDVPLLELGSLAGLEGSLDRDEAFFSFTSFARPPTMYRWTPDETSDWSRLHELDPGTGSRGSASTGSDDTGSTADEPIPEPGPAGSSVATSATAGSPTTGSATTDSGGTGTRPAGSYVVEQVRYPSSDGTEIPMFLVRSARTEPSPSTPCVLTGYGGFSVSMSPGYSAAVVAVCDAGGIYAVANIRGGAEDGEAWHQAGMRSHKQQSFDDFIAAADWLVGRGLTSRERLAIRGGSNGGLLMGAAITQRPDLCAAAQIAVPLLDMVRYHRFLIARLWMPEYGDPDRAEEFAWLYAYSPYHRVIDGTCYPAVLLTTAEEDSRVDPSHARKMAARLQEATSCGHERPILLREEARAGHGQGKPVSKQADELADVLSFLAWQLDWDVVEGVTRTAMATGSDELPTRPRR